MKTKAQPIAIAYSLALILSACADDNEDASPEGTETATSTDAASGTSGTGSTDPDDGPTTDPEDPAEVSTSSGGGATADTEAEDETGKAGGDETSSGAATTTGDATTGGADDSTGVAGGVSTACDGNRLGAPIAAGATYDWTFDFEEVGTTSDAEVGLHLIVGDTSALRFSLTHDGTTTMVIDGQCSGEAGLDVDFADGAAPLDCSDLLSGAEASPTEPFAPFVGSPSEGEWTVTVENLSDADVSLDIDTVCITVHR